MSPPPRPVIVGAAQLTQRWGQDGDQLDPLRLMAAVSSRLVKDTGLRADLILPAIDRLAIVNTLTWSYRDAPGDLVGMLGLGDVRSEYSGVGGNTPQLFVNRVAEELQNGKCNLALIVGAESGYSARRIHKDNLDLGWPATHEPTRIDGDDRLGSSNIEFAHELLRPSFVYPLFETNLRAASGRSPDEHNLFLGQLYQKFSTVAAANPLAWSRDPHSAEDIATPSADNRYIGYPYTKLMNANMNVDQAAGLLLTTEPMARRLGIDEELWVYPQGGAHLNDVWYVSERPHLDTSPAVAQASRLALQQAGIDLHEISAFDLYSCFPSAVQMACNALGLEEGEARSLTLTGGLAYFGGPGNNYSMHAIAEAVCRVRQDPSFRALVSALGWYATKHAVGIYGKAPPVRPWDERATQKTQKEIDSQALPQPVTEAEGDITVEAFVIRHQRAGGPRSGVVLGRLSSGLRTLAEIQASPDELEDLETVELVGRTARVNFDRGAGINRARFA